jgi:hypothetical protein
MPAAATRDFNPSASVVIALKGSGSRAGEHRPIQAEVYGAWAVHASCGATILRDPFSVTHIPTGDAVLTDHKLEAARWLAEQLHARVPAFDATEGPQWLSAAPIIKEIAALCP